MRSLLPTNVPQVDLSVLNSSLHSASLLGHVSVQTTERYLGCKQRLRNAVNDHIGLEPDTPS
jgi:hypothetical protein